MRALVVAVSAVLVTCGGVAVAQQSMTFNWEDGVSTALGTYNNVVLENTAEQAQSGSRSLKYTKSPNEGSTPQVYVWWITGCADGDVIDASFYVYDVTGGTYPSGRIWAHYTSDPNDISSYSGSASGSASYSSGIGWEQLSHQWTFASSGDDEGFVVEARIYATAGADSVIYIDNTSISTTSSTAVIHNAAGAVPVELVSFAATVDREEVELSWSTASESNNMGFNILRAIGMSDRTRITAELIPGAGTTLSPQSYGFLDRDVAAGMTYYYWLEQVDFSGLSEVFGPVMARVPAEVPKGLSLAFSPQPVADHADVQFSVPQTGPAEVMLYDMQGRMVAQLWQGMATGSHIVRWDRAGTPSGFYMLRILTHLGSTGQPIVLK
ncbi:T9SS type A sorting domain-containing protein [Candidatus Fermentibacteria bacterium]|nr:T9SS type A sorting domain-containing protein [Candidatus Fermentibacteria bacterium]